MVIQPTTRIIRALNYVMKGKSHNSQSEEELEDEVSTASSASSLFSSETSSRSSSSRPLPCDSLTVPPPTKVSIQFTLVSCVVMIAVSYIAGRVVHHQCFHQNHFSVPVLDDTGTCDSSSNAVRREQTYKIDFIENVDRLSMDGVGDRGGDDSEYLSGASNGTTKQKLEQFLLDATGVDPTLIDSSDAVTRLLYSLVDIIGTDDPQNDETATTKISSMFTLKGHYTHEQKTDVGSRTKESDGIKAGLLIHAIGLIQEGGHITISAWPSKGTVLMDFLIPSFPTRPTTSTARDDDDRSSDDDDDDDHDDTDEAPCHKILEKLHEIFSVFYRNDDEAQHKLRANRLVDLKSRDPDTRDTIWSFRHRGFDATTNVDALDLAGSLQSLDELKERVVSVVTNYQTIDIVDSFARRTIEPFYESYQQYPEYFEANPGLFRPDRSLYMDGVIQSRRSGLSQYHEALVQPSMFAHPHPKRVAIVGGGECATLREALKHNTVEKVIMIEIDPDIVEISKTYLHEWNDCSNLEGSTRYCMDDPRVEIHYQDALKWFIDRFGKRHDEDEMDKDEDFNEDPFDVIILDALDPQNAVDFVEALYGDGLFLGSLYNGLTDQGILLTQVGSAVDLADPSETIPGNYHYQRAVYTKGLINQGFQSIVDYNLPHAGFGEEQWSFYAAFKNNSTQKRWFLNEAHLNLEIHQRSVRTLNGDSPFYYFDGPTMSTYRYPTKAADVNFCRILPSPAECHIRLLDPFWSNNSTEAISIKGRGDRMYADVRIEASSKLYLQHSGDLTPITRSLLLKESDYPVFRDSIKPAKEYLFGKARNLD